VLLPSDLASRRSSTDSHDPYAERVPNVLEDEGWRTVMHDEQYKLYGG
jgi:hypothetical protein